MSKIRIKNFGPIKKGYLVGDGWIDIKKVTVFIGNQGSGKSTIAKLISIFTWMEKALTRGDFDKKAFEKKDVFRKFCEYHKIENYIEDLNSNKRTEINYIGDSFSINYHERQLKFEYSLADKYELPQIMYVPADRNFLSTVDDLKSQRIFSPSLVELLAEMQKATKQIKGKLKLPVNNVDLEYDKTQDILNIKGEDYDIRLAESSSGFQSLVPLYLVTWFLANSVKRKSENSHQPMSIDESERFRKEFSDIYINQNLTEEQKRIAISVLSSKFNKTAFINIVEEPEQNLFPTSQKQMLYSLLELNNLSEGNKLIITTHSPYLINYLSIAVQGESLLRKIKSTKKSSINAAKFGLNDNPIDALGKIIPIDALISSTDLVIYQLNETDGTISKLSSFEGIPSDNNYLNKSLADGNQIFDSLLALEEEL
ncbi:MAG: AAA family ATPase [Bacteroidota bacterium]